jgi:uncharacterized membrane protein YeaQ/YmgE (transglycosylase-associated protein family)
MTTATKTRTERAAAAETADATEARYEHWNHWPVNWTAVWAGALAGVATALIFGLIGIAVGAHLLGPEHRVADLHKFGLGALIFSVCGAFFAFVIAGWVTGKIAGILRAEPAMLHGAVAWLVATPLLVVLVGLGAGSLFGGWYAGLGGNPPWAAPAVAPFERPEPLAVGASETERSAYQTALTKYQEQVKQWREDTPRATRNAALGAVTALLLGLIGSVLGGWLACGEPMTLTYYRHRPAAHSHA